MTSNPENQSNDDTRAYPGDPTAPLPVDSTAREGGTTYRESSPPGKGAVQAEAEPPAHDSPAAPATRPARPTGPHAPAIVLGLVCLVVAGLVLAQELGTLSVDWGNVGPLGIVAAGAVLVVLGLVGLLSSRRSG